MADIKLVRLNKIYDNKFHAVKDIDLNIEDREFVVLVGPSGCGKSTTLRMIAGLEKATSGNIFIGNSDVTNEEPSKRDIAMVFQNYALYPHMTVYENMSFALKLRKMKKADIDKTVKEVSEMLGITELLKRKPAELSGGQRQRVALGRAMIRTPKVFLMDEPLSNLDAKLRVKTRAEIIKLHKLLNTTFVYVTHDQTEAMTMGSRIVVMNNGRIQQVDTPKNIYENPRNMFVAGFIGSPQINFLSCKVKNKGDFINIELDNNEINIENKENIKVYEGKKYILGIRSENVLLSKIDDAIQLRGVVDVIEYLGSESIVYVKTKLGEVIAKINVEFDLDEGENVEIYLRKSDILIFDEESEERLI